MLILLTAFMALLYTYVELRCILYIHLPLWLKIGFSAFLALGIFNIIVVLFWGRFLPDWLCRFFSVAQVLLIYLVISTLFLDILRLFHIPVVPLAYWMILGCVLFSGYAVWNASRLPKVQRVEISSSLLPADWQPLKIVQLTDFHIGQGFHEQWLRQVVQKTNTLLPDVIVITGDSIDNTVEQLLPELLPLKDLKAEKGVYMVFGNHEYYYDSKAWQRAFEAMGIKVLKNNHVVLENSKDAFVLGGGDWGASLKAGQADAHVEQTFTGSDEQLPRILLSHYPLAWKASLKHNVLLQLSGHTHGGMSFPVNFLTSLFNGGYLRGLYEKDGRFLYVSDGTGLWGGFPARAGTQNEIVEIILKRKEGA